MGQYHKIYNLDKKETINANALDSGVKLAEMCSTDHFMAALLILLSNSNGRGGGDFINKEAGKIQGRWSGDRIVIQGDYARDTDNAYVDKDNRAKFKDISDLVLQFVNKFKRDYGNS